jgi:large subunit ribosomal protein L17
MAHRVAGRHLKRSTDARRRLFRNLVGQLFRYERIRTTEAKALAIRGDAERVITWAKRGGIQARRLAFRAVNDDELVKKIFDEVAPRYADRAGGYTRIVKLGNRQGDAAPMVVLELTQ